MHAKASARKRTSYPLIDSQDYFEKVIAYVHLNPVSANIVDDPADYRQSGHRAVLGISPPRITDVQATLNGFGGRPWSRSRRAYQEWLRAVAQCRWLSAGVTELPWWIDARDVDEIASAGDHPGAVTHDGRVFEQPRDPLDADVFLRRFERASGYRIAELASRSRRADVVRARIELAVLAVARHGLRSSRVAAALDKDPTTVSRWLSKGLRLRLEDDDFARRVDDLDRSVSGAAFNNAEMPRVAP